MIPFAAVDTKYIILGTGVFEKHIQNSIIQDFTMNFKHPFNDQLTIASFTKLTEKNFPFFSAIYQINSKKSIYIKPNTVQRLHFQLENSKTLLLRTENHEPVFAERPQTQFLSKLNCYFFSWKLYRRILKIRAQ